MAHQTFLTQSAGSQNRYRDCLQALLDLFADGIVNVRVLLLVNYRPVSKLARTKSRRRFYVLRLRSLL